jgi:transposase
LELALFSQSRRIGALDDPPNLESLQSSAASRRDLQVVDRSPVPRKSARYLRPYLSPPERAIVLCVDEKSQIQALDRTQPLLPMRPGQVERRTHEYTRHGTLSLFAALDAATGRVLGKCFARHRAREFRAFLNVIDKQIGRGAHRSTEELETIANYIDAVNAKPKPFVWTKSADDILARVKRFCASILSAAQISIATTSKSRH